MWIELMLWMWAILLLIALIVFWALNFIGLPGNWINVVVAAFYAWLMPLEHRADIGWVVVAIMVGLALLGELIEFAAGSAGAASVGGSARSAALAMVGAITGSIVGLIWGLPIPIIGSVVAALLFSSLGALLGAMLGEQWKGRDLDESFKVGHAAFWGRLFGTLGKLLVGTVMIAVAAAGVFL